MSDKTTILSRQGQTLYRVSTAQNPDSKDIETAIQRGEGETIAVLHWRGLLPDKLESTLEEVQAPQIKYCKFLRSLKPSTFEMSGKTYEWVNRAAGQEPALLEEGRRTPIVLFEEAKKDISTFKWDPPQLWCEFSALGMIDTIIVTFLVLWKNQRTKASLGL